MQMWDRQIQVTIYTRENTISFSRGAENQSLFFEVETTLDITNSSNIAKVTIYNLDNNTVKQLVRGAEIEIQAGYGNKLGVVYNGMIEKVEGKKENNHVKYTIICSTYNDEYKETKIDLKVAKNYKASAVINVLISKLDRLKLGKIELGEDIQYKDGKTMHNNLKNILTQIAKDTKSIFYNSNGKLYFQKANVFNRGTFTLDKEYILDITPNENGYTVKSVFSSNITEGMKFNANFKDDISNIEVSGSFPVVKVKHNLTLKNDFYTEFEILNQTLNKLNEKKIEIVVGGSSKTQKSNKKVKGAKTKTKSNIFNQKLQDLKLKKG